MHVNTFTNLLILASMSIHIHYDVWYTIDLIPDFNGAAVEVWEKQINFISHFTGRMLTYPCCG